MVGPIRDRLAGRQHGERIVLTIGIDPGLTGAAGILNADGTFRAVFDLPVIRDHSLAWIDGQELTSRLLQVREGQPARAVVERVSAMPGQGVSSSFTFGATVGSILAAVQAARLPIELATPATWKGALRLGKDKHAALHRARLLFPDAELPLAKHHGRAEALLLAYWSHMRTERKA